MPRLSTCRLYGLVAAFVLLVLVCSVALAAQYKVGQVIQVKWHDNWWPATILEVNGSKYKIHYTGWGAEWDETVALDRMRDPFAIKYKGNQKVQVEWKGKWYAATILQVGTGAQANKYKIHYDGWGAEWDEWVGPERIN